MRKTIKKIIPKKWYLPLSKLAEKLNIGNENVCYAQEGEDLILNNIFNDKKKGFYVDVGANHPIKYSNTYALNRKGWHGITIDPLYSKALYKSKRKNNLHFTCGIWSKEIILAFFEDQEHRRSTFLPNHKNCIVTSKQLHCYSLKQILNTCCKRQIDLMSIDVEGSEFEVLKGNDWKLYSPKVIAIEDLNYMQLKGKTKINKFLEKKGYWLFARTSLTSIYLRSDFNKD